MQVTLEVIQLEAVIKCCLCPKLFQEEVLLPLASATPRLLERGFLGSLSLGGGSG